MLEYKIGLVGPSRIGKTTLMTCVLEAGESLFKDSDFSMVANDEDGTEGAITSNKDELNGAIKQGMTIGFNAAALGGSVDFRKYNFYLKNKLEDIIQLSFIDFPGGWLKDKPSKWKSDCEPELNDSCVLMIPVDSALIMEANLPKYRASVPSLLQLSLVENVVRKWAKRQRNSNQDCCIILAPVKCETYLKHKSKDLETKVRGFYKDILTAAKDELGTYSSSLKIYYCPIKTFGCVELKRSNWVENEKGGYTFSGDYRTNTLHPERKQEYAGDILKIIVESICKIDKNSKEIDLKDKKQSEENTRFAKYNCENMLNQLDGKLRDKIKEKDNLGFFASIYEWFTNEKQKEIDRLNVEKSNTNYQLGQANSDLYQKSQLTQKAQSDLQKVYEIFDYIKNKKVDNCRINMTNQI